MKIIVHGAGGKMGELLCRKISLEEKNLFLAAKVSRHFEKDFATHNYPNLWDVREEADCVADFSNRAATGRVLDFCVEKRLSLLLATTGQTEEEQLEIYQAAKEIPIFFAPNLSLGIAFLTDAVKRAAAILPNADVELVEVHHRQKWDVPSGTALSIAKELQSVRKNASVRVGRGESGVRKEGEICIHSLRLGEEVGTHQIYLSSGSETLTLTHTATNRSVFANGAVEALKFLEKKPAGLYGMMDLLLECKKEKGDF